MARLGFIGASGLMGHGMAKNLLARGHALGHGKKFVPALVEAQEQLTGARIVGR